MRKDVMKNTGTGIFFIVFSLIYMLGAGRIRSFSPFGSRGLDSQSIPQMLGVLMCALAVSQVALTIQKNKREKTAAASAAKEDGTGGVSAEEAPKEKRAEKNNAAAVWGSIGLLVAYVVVYQRLGFILSTLAYLLSATTLLTPAGKRGKMMFFIVPFSAAVTIFIYYVFTKYLALFLPRGILG